MHKPLVLIVLLAITIGSTVWNLPIIETLADGTQRSLTFENRLGVSYLYLLFKGCVSDIILNPTRAFNNEIVQQRIKYCKNPALPTTNKEFWQCPFLNYCELKDDVIDQAKEVYPNYTKCKNKKCTKMPSTYTRPMSTCYAYMDYVETKFPDVDIVPNPTPGTSGLCYEARASDIPEFIKGKPLVEPQTATQ